MTKKWYTVVYMRQTIVTLLFLIGALFIPLNVIAQQSPSTSDTRLSQAVADQQLTLDDATKNLTIEKCQAAQTEITQLQDKTDKLVRLRTDTYSTIQKELQAIKLRMGRQGVDASEIDLLIGKLQQGLDKFTLAADSYGTALDDIESVDCVQKPEQFRAGIVVARAKQAQLYTAASDIKKILTTADTTTFEQLKKRLTV